MMFSMKYLQLYSSQDSQELKRQKLVQQCMALSLFQSCILVIQLLDTYIRLGLDLQMCICAYTIINSQDSMTTYGSAYFNVLEKISNQYLGLHNLNTLTHLQNKLKCYTQYNTQPHEYYACYMKVEQKRENDSKELVSSYNLIEEEFKLCNEGCKAIGSQGSNCINTCTERFTGNVQNLYEAFYRNRVGTRKEYKKARN